MTKTGMIKKLETRFGTFAIEQSVWMHTGYRTGKLHDLSENELTDLYRMFFPEKTEQEIIINQRNESYLKTLRSIVLKDAQHIGLYDPYDWSHFNEFMLKYSPHKKPLPKYSVEEMEALIKQFKSMRTKFDKESIIPGTKAWHLKNRLPIPSKN